MNVKLIAKTDTGILSYTEFLSCIARRCYSIKSFDHIKDCVIPNSAEPKNKQVDAEKLLKKVIESKHLSILEHLSLTFSIENVPVTLVSQLTRHRLASFAVTSLRYNNLKKCKNVEYYIPEFKSESDRAEFLISCAEAINTYDNMISKGYKPEEARYVLPQGIMTNLVMTMNVRELFHFFDLRNCLRADKPIRELAKKILKLCLDVDPYLFGFAKHNCLNCDNLVNCNINKDGGKK